MINDYSIHFKRIREEWGKPFGDVVRELANEGHSKLAVSQILELSYNQSYRKYLKLYAADAEWSPNGRTLAQRRAFERIPVEFTDKQREQSRKLARKTRERYLVTVQGKTGTMRELAKHFGISIYTVNYRRRNGMSLEEALTTPPSPHANSEAALQARRENWRNFKEHNYRRLVKHAFQLKGPVHATR